MSLPDLSADQPSEPTPAEPETASEAAPAPEPSDHRPVADDQTQPAAPSPPPEADGAAPDQPTETPAEEGEATPPSTGRAGVDGAGPRRWFRRRPDSEGGRPLISGDDLDRLTADLHRLRSRLTQPSPDEARLRTRISIAARELASRAAPDGPEPWAGAAAGLIGDARRALEAGQVVDGWQLLRAAERQLVDGRESEELEDDLETTRLRLLELAPAAADKVPSRQPKDLGALRGIVRRVRGLLDSYLDELGRIVHQRSRMLGHVALLLWSVLILAGLAVSLGLPGSSPGRVLSSFGSYVTVVGLGVAGAVISRALAGENNRGQQVQAAMNPLLIHLFRLGLGGTAALVVVVLLQANVQGLLDASGPNAYPFALAAGFTERLADRVFASTERSCRDLAARSLGVDQS